MTLLINSLNSDESNLALAIQCSDTLNTIINDRDVIPRISPYINELLEKVSENIISVKIPEFFDFLSEIFKFL